MAEDQSAAERTEPPTERRKQQAKEKGQVPRSRELNTMLSLISGALGLIVFGDSMANSFITLFESSLTFDRELAYDSSLMAVRLMQLILSSIVILLPLFGVLMVGALVGPVAMGGWSFSPAAIAPKLEKISPLKGLQRIFSAKGLAELLKAIMKFLFLAGATILLFQFVLDEVLNLGDRTPSEASGYALTILTWSLLVLSSAMIFIAAIDVPFELWNHNRQLKMTRQEVLDELKESDGRPEVKNRIRALQREIAQRRMMEALPTADVVITNPTHFSVALKYSGSAGEAPIVVAKGADLLAYKIRSVATAHDVPLFSAPPLARTLYATTDIGQQIPENLYLAVAKVLAYVMQLRNPAAERPTPPDDITIPDVYHDLPIHRGVTNDE